jgi:hypothetical protein
MSPEFATGKVMNTSEHSAKVGVSKLGVPVDIGTVIGGLFIIGGRKEITA